MLSAYGFVRVFLKMEENRVLLTQSLSEKEQLMMDDQQTEEQTTQEVDGKQDIEVQYSCNKLKLRFEIPQNVMNTTYLFCESCTLVVISMV